MWYDVLCEDLPQEDEEGYSVEGVDKSFKKRSDIVRFFKSKDGVPDNLSDTLLTESNVKERIANQSPYNKKTVKRLIRLGKLPHKILILVSC